MQGLNTRFRVWTETQASDDLIGGAVYTGTISQNYINGHLSVTLPNQMLLEQGLETTKIADAFVWPGSITLQERDVLEIVGPTHHEYFGKFFRIIGLKRGDHHAHSRRRFWKARLRRIDYTRTEEKI